MKPKIEEPVRLNRIVALGNQKGGVGKTTNTVHIAAALAEMGRKCLIFDLDMNHGATRHFGLPSDAFLGAFEVLTGDELPSGVILSNEDKELVQEGVELPDNLHLIPSRRKLEKIDKALAEKNKFVVTQDVLLEPLRTLDGIYDYIFLDTAPNATTPTIAAYKAARWFILSAIPDPFAIAGLNDALTDIQGAQQHGNPGLKLLGVVLSMVDKRTTLANQLSDYVERIFKADEAGQSAKFETSITRSTVIPQCQDKGKTLFETHPTHRVTDQYRSLAREVESRIDAFEQTVSKPAKDLVLTMPTQLHTEVAVNG